ncbi:MAG: hypothetical protein NZ898_12225 [Myxococcota bacterium]|nr:hypothetical protein [Myxococcota bacterium]MDW8363265.1 hypothetical protein [Myxococcales bacterium]
MTPADAFENDGSNVDSGSGADVGVDARVEDGAALDVGPADTGVDVGVDTGADAGLLPDAGTMDAGCRSAADCADRRACNGTERCVAGVCMPGVPVACDDGIDCTVDSCVEPAGTCMFSPDDTRCPAGLRCNAVMGCTRSTMCAESPCRLVAPQCGCPSGQGCYNMADGTRYCASAGTRTTGSACTAVNQCRAGDTCVALDPMTGICVHYCATDADCSGAGALCILELSDGGGGTLPGIRLCTRSCDPITASGCPAGTTCQIFREAAGAMRWLTDCAVPVGMRRQGQPCDPMTLPCDRGFVCLDPDGSGPRSLQCLRWCDATRGTGCALGETCFGFMTPVVIGTVEYGVCFAG